MVPSKGDGTSRLLIGASCLKIAKFSSVIVSTHELVRLPGNVTGKFNLKIKMALRGLFVQMGTQVEPNYHGRLFALLQNISDEEVIIEPRSDTNKIFAIEFYYTSNYIPTEASDFEERKIDQIGQFIKEIAFSGTINNITTELEQRLDRVEKENATLRVDLRGVSSRLEDVTPQINQATERLFSTKSFVIGAALLAVLSILVSVVAPIVAKMLLDSKPEQGRLMPASGPISNSPASIQKDSDGVQSPGLEPQPLRRPSASGSLNTTELPTDRAQNESKDPPR
jgi:dUTPase